MGKLKAGAGADGALGFYPVDADNMIRQKKRHRGACGNWIRVVQKEVYAKAWW